jgi:hypothetical protein
MLQLQPHWQAGNEDRKSGRAISCRVFNLKSKVVIEHAIALSLAVADKPGR